jgi:hypothetical protein
MNRERHARIGLLLPREMRDGLEVAARASERTLSQEARVAIREHLGGHILAAVEPRDFEVRG